MQENCPATKDLPLSTRLEMELGHDGNIKPLRKPTRETLFPDTALVFSYKHPNIDMTQGSNALKRSLARQEAHKSAVAAR